MASEKQIEANRRNAQLSTGPKTPEGKAAVSRNALKHGFHAAKILFQDGNEEHLADLRDGLTAHWQPRNYTECALLEQMAIALHKLACFEDLEEMRGDAILDRNFHPNLLLIWRRQAALERSFHRALDALLKLRRHERQSQSAGPQPQPADPPSAPQYHTTPEHPSPAEPALPGSLIVRDGLLPPDPLSPGA